MRIAVLWEEAFPTLDSAPLTLEALRAAFAGKHDVQFVRAADLDGVLAEQPDLFVTPYGSAFPKPAWPAFVGYLRRRGNWVNLGGAPLTRPVRFEQGEWRVEVEQTAYCGQLGINHCVEVAVPDEAGLRCPALDADLETHFHLFRPSVAWSLQVRFTATRDFPAEHGSSGRRDAALRPLAVAEVDSRRIAAPIVAIDRLAGQYAGGRWVLAACAGSLPLPADLIRQLCEYALRPRATVEVRPSFACYYPGEMAALVVNACGHTPGDLKINIRVYSRDTQKEVYAHTYRARSGLAPAIVQTSPFPVHDPGLYIVRAYVGADGRSKPIAVAETGFWVYDRDLMAAGKPLELDADYFHQAGRPLPVTGTTYMASDAHRKFLFEPNPAVWDADFAAMRQAGVNMVRTGLWTGWKRVMVGGAVDEGVLRALMAYVLTARHHEMPLIFNLFAFLPEAWGGDHPYLDPSAVESQTAFVAAFARRLANVNDLAWDLINEPAFCGTDRSWQTHPNYSASERVAWEEWLGGQGVTADEWRERWRLTPEEPLGLPAPEDFRDAHLFETARPLRALDYRRFAQEKFREWAAHMRAVIAENGNPGQLVTVGQDEGGFGERPDPRFHGSAIDFTTNHSWWANDALLWDSLVAKTPDRPCLIGETGIMFSERPDGSPSRTPDDARKLLERKMALAFAGGCAGFIQWLWNSNLFMASDNEAAIGFLRADGTEKPELAGFRGVARFFAANAQYLVGRRQERVCVVTPTSNLLGVRRHAERATQRAVRALEYGLGLPCRMVDEYSVAAAAGASLVLMPAPRVATEACWRALLGLAETGATVLVTGFIEADEYWRSAPRLGPFGFVTTPVPVSQSAHVRLPDGRIVAGRFGGDKSRAVERAAGPDGPLVDCRLLEIGRGKLLYCPVPVELSDDEAMARAVYAAAAGEAGLAITERPAGLLVRAVELEAAALLLCVNESDVTVSGAPGLPDGVEVAPGGIALAFVERGSGKTLAVYTPRG